jgi:uncharacterized protein (TIGR04562 family)
VDKQENYEKIINQWDFDWPLMEVLVGGKSSIDLPSLHVKNYEEASEFVLNYGYDADNDADQRKLHSFIVESFSFIQNILMPREWMGGNRPPGEVFNCSDVRCLLLWASDQDEEYERRRNWSCSVLRVVHTIAHLHGVQKRADLVEARKQIMGRFEKYIFRNKDGELRLGDENMSLALDRVEWKNFKKRDSIILKLLHKQGNVAEAIYDFLGIRLITKRKSDVMMVAKFFRDFYMVTFPNMSPARSRNTVVGLNEFREFVALHRQNLKEGAIDSDKFLELIENDFVFADKVQKRSTNPHSSASYKSIQMTCRQLIRYENPMVAWSRKINDWMEASPFLRDVAGGEKRNPAQRAVEEMLSVFKNTCELQNSSEISVFFPFEVQIMDSQSYAEGEGGEASHSRYKKSQIRTARKRILHHVLKK